jgi:hypothetical protein
VEREEASHTWAWDDEVMGTLFEGELLAQLRFVTWLGMQPCAILAPEGAIHGARRRCGESKDYCQEPLTWKGIPLHTSVVDLNSPVLCAIASDAVHQVFTFHDLVLHEIRRIGGRRIDKLIGSARAGDLARWRRYLPMADP